MALGRARRTGRWGPLTQALDRAARHLASLVPETPRTPREHVLASYRRMVGLLEGLGMARREGMTPREFARLVRQERDWPEVDEITGCFEEARYGSAPVDEEVRRRSAEALHRLQSQVRSSAGERPG